MKFLNKYLINYFRSTIICMIYSIRRYKIIGARRISNFFWASTIFLASFFFSLTGLASFWPNSSLDIFHNADSIQFWPQGLIMIFYGILGFIFSLYLLLTIFWSIGSGFNEFNSVKQEIRIFRWGFPGKNRRIDLNYSYNEIVGIRLELKQGFNEQKNLYLQIRDKREIPLSRLGQPLTYSKIEEQAAELAKFLQVSLSLSN